MMKEIIDKNVKYHIVYKTTNLINGKWYIGKHSTYNLDDGYLGSSQHLKSAIKKYGKDNFQREIICYCNSEEEAYIKEAELVTMEVVNDPNSYNKMPGGEGGQKRFTDEELKKHWQEYYRDYKREWDEKNKEHLREYKRKWKEANKEHRREYNRRWREKHREEINAKQRANYDTNREEINAKRRANYDTNREHIREQRQKYYKANREQRLEYQRKYYKANREQIREYQLEYQRVYYEANREKINAKQCAWYAKNKKVKK